MVSRIAPSQIGLSQPAFYSPYLFYGQKGILYFIENGQDLLFSLLESNLIFQEKEDSLYFEVK